MKSYWRQELHLQTVRFERTTSLLGTPAYRTVERIRTSTVYPLMVVTLLLVYNGVSSTGRESNSQTWRLQLQAFSILPPVRSSGGWIRTSSLVLQRHLHSLLCYS